MSDNTAHLTQDAEPIFFTNRFFILTDNDAYVTGMMIAINQDEADRYESKDLAEVPKDIFESIGQDSKYIDGQVIQGQPRIPVLNGGSVNAIKSGLLREATDRIQILQDAIDLEMSEEGDDLRLINWKKYRVLLSRVDILMSQDISWPEAPKD
ncbi:tail fiber assembly protein [Tatumella saanichensis]|uniref:tail fiber assembly protein n=1 Tax=Tatumella saanichensis TaxID=480813 RepID=UPI0004B25FA0|nr:tail fiber assembly protein [Tatumella saanichensis]